MKTKICLYLVVFALASGGPALGQVQDIVLDLNSPVANQPVRPNVEIRIFVDNMTPPECYEVKILKRFVEIEPIAWNLVASRANRQRIGTTYILQTGEEIVVEIKRSKVDGTGCDKNERSWTFVLTTGPRGEWRTTYGFTFVPDGDRKYFSRQLSDDPEKFEIVREAEREDFDFLPSVLFTWLPAKHRLRDWSHGPTGGLGADTESISVLAGYSFVYNENLAFTVGLAMHEQTRLEGNFNEGNVSKRIWLRTH